MAWQVQRGLRPVDEKRFGMGERGSDPVIHQNRAFHPDAANARGVCRRNAIIALGAFCR